jgi:geranylgeranyl pyrophosphate synthase
VALEVAHTAILIRDDVVDGDSDRNGHPTIHALATGEGYGWDGSNVGHFTADCLFALAVMPVLEASFDTKQKIELLKILQVCTARTAEGQIDELLLVHTPFEKLTEAAIEAVYVSNGTDSC